MQLLTGWRLRCLAVVRKARSSWGQRPDAFGTRGHRRSWTASSHPSSTWSTVTDDPLRPPT